MAKKATITKTDNYLEDLMVSFGMDEPWKPAVFMPASYWDCRFPSFYPGGLDKREKLPILLKVVSVPGFSGYGSKPRLAFKVEDDFGARYSAAVFGDSKFWLEKLVVGHSFLFVATGHEFAGNFHITIHDILPDKYIGRIMPVYNTARRKITPELLRSMVARRLKEAVPLAAVEIAGKLSGLGDEAWLMEQVGAPGWTIEMLLKQAHYPYEPTYIEPVRRTLQKLAALGSLQSAAAKSQACTQANPISLSTLDSRMSELPFALTCCQEAAIRDIASDLASSERLANRILAGDVGVGKTACMHVTAAATADAGRRAMLLFPSTLVANQAYVGFQKAYPDVRATLVTGDTGGMEDLDAPVLMGTSALLHRKVPAVDVLMVDEQHRWSREQREHHQSERTHLIELSATCIPRTQALIRFGHVNVSEMRQTPKPKTFKTSLHVGPDEERALGKTVSKIIQAGHPLFIIYPKREGGDEEDTLNIADAFERWEQRFPGRVAHLTGDAEESEKEEAVQSIRDGRKQILLSTTVVEVGVDVPGLRHILIINPQNYGLVQLHQLRGRVARAGGEGFCYLLAPGGMSEASKARLQPFLDTTDGFKLAEADLLQRGAGDLSASSAKQHGADGAFLLDMKIELDVYDEVMPILTKAKNPKPCDF